MAEAAVDQAKEVLITGGSGFIGTHLARLLTSRSARVVSVDIRPPREVIAGVRHVTLDVRNLHQLDTDGVGAIYNLAAIHTTPGHPENEYYDVNVEGALSVCEFATAHDVQDILFTSSISVYGPSEDRKVEDSVLAPASSYGRSKRLAELIHTGWAQRAPARRLRIARPAVVFGAGEGGNFTRMASLLKKGFFVFPGRRDTIKSCIHVRDLISIFDALMSQDRLESVIVANGAYPECPTIEEIVLKLRAAHFPKAKLLDVPKPAVNFAASAVKLVGGVGGIHPERVEKLVRSTFVYPVWAVANGVLTEGAFDRGIARWAEETNGSFV